MMESNGSFDESQLFDIAEDVGLDVVRLKKDMELRGVQGILDDTKVLADKLSISGTPAIIVGEELIRGAIGKERLKSLIGQVRN
jgi:predicted DsbA family dithiol-disulfide isomerase